MMLASALDSIGILDAAIVALLGYAVVFFGLILLMCVIICMGKIFIAKDKKAAAKAAAAVFWALFLSLAIKILPMTVTTIISRIKPKNTTA